MFDFNNNTLKKNEVSIKWYLGYYSTFTNSKNVKTINQMRKAVALLILTEQLHAHKNHLQI